MHISANKMNTSKIIWILGILLGCLPTNLAAQYMGGTGRGDVSLLSENQPVFNILYVKFDAVGANNGTSWANAYTSFQSALDAAVSGDQIWVAKGTYKPSSAYDLTNTSRYYHFRMVPGVEIYGGFAGIETLVSQRTDFGIGGANEAILSGDLNGDDVVTGSGATLAFSNNGENCYHVFYHPDGAGLTNAAVLNGFTISGGNANEINSPHNVGGGMVNFSNHPSIYNSVFMHNVAFGGGGAIKNGMSSGFGSSPILMDCTLKNNLTSGAGGGMSNDHISAPKFTNCSIVGNRAGTGGGVYTNYYCPDEYRNCYFIGNHASGSGGAMFNNQYSWSKYINCVFANNTASGTGGGLYIALSRPESIVNCTFYNNIAGSLGGGIYVQSLANVLHIRNSVLWANASGNGNQLFSNQTTEIALHHTCFSNISGDIVHSGTLTTSNDNITTDPVLANPNIGDFRLMGHSPCINTGDNSYNVTSTDIRGQVRIQNGTIDIGAYEWTSGLDPKAPIFVDFSKTAGANNGTSWANAYTSFQSALDAAVSGDEIWVAKGIYKPTVQVGGTGTRFQAFQMKNGVAIYGGFAGTETMVSQRTDFAEGGANETILSGDLNGNDDYSVFPWLNTTENVYNVFYHPNGLGLTNASILDGFIIQGGAADGSRYEGAGMFNHSSSPTIHQVVFRYNRAHAGAGLYLRASNTICSNVQFLNNSADYGGGSAVDQNSTPQFINVLFAANRASINGGGIYNQGSGSVLFVNATIANNTATNGGGIYNNGSGITLQNSIIWGNQASASSYPGHQIFNYSSSPISLYSSCISSAPGDILHVSVIPTQDLYCITTDPQFADAPNGDYRLLCVSPCADEGNDSYNSLLTDIRGAGFGRKLLRTDYTQSGTIDMGAYEYNNNSDPMGCANPPSGGTIAGNQTICNGADPVAFTSVALPTSYCGTLEYKWQSSTTGSSAGFSDISGTNSEVYDAPAVTQTTWFKRMARADCMTDWSGAAESNVLEVSVRSQFTAGAIATTGETICSGGDPGVIVSTITSSGGDNAITYEWRASGTPIASTNASTYDPPTGLASTTTYTRWAKDGVCNTTFTQSTGSWVVTLLAYQPPVVNDPPGVSTVVCVDQITVPVPPDATDICDGTISGVLHSVVDSPTPIECEGTRVYTFSYTNSNSDVSYWTYTYTVNLSTPPTEVGGPVAIGSIIQHPDQAVPPILPDVEDACGNPVLISQATGLAYIQGPLMPHHRMGHYGATLPDGRVGMFGGHTTNFQPTNTVSILSPDATAMSSATMNYHHDMYAFTHLFDGTYLLAGGTGSGGSGHYAHSEIYDPASNTFTSVGSMIRARTFGNAATLTDGRVLIAGGWYGTANGASTYGELYDPVAKTFSSVGPFSIARSHVLIMPTNNNKAVVFGGRAPTGGAVTQRIELYDPATGTISTVRNELFSTESGWVTSYNLRQTYMQKLNNGKYMWLASRNAGTYSEYTVFTFDPLNLNVEHFNTSSPLPNTSAVSFLNHPLIDNQRNVAYLIGLLPATNTLKLFSFKLSSGVITEHPETYNAGYYISGIAMNLLQDGRILISGGSSTGDNYTPVKNTIIITPPTLSHQIVETKDQDSCQTEIIYRYQFEDCANNTFDWDYTYTINYLFGEIETAGETVCAGITPSLIGSIDPAAGGEGTVEYKWQSSPDGSAWTDISSTNSETWQPAALSTTTHFRRLARYGTCNSFTASTGVWIVTVTPLPTFTYTTSDISCFSGSDGTITINASGGSGSGYEYRIHDGSSWSAWQSGNAFSGLPAGNYTIEIRDGNGCVQKNCL